MATAQGQQWIRLSPEKTIEFPTSGANASVTVNLKLTNVSGGYLAYKIKTTAPRNYLVRPSSGVINPQGDAIVEIILQANATGEGGPPTNDRFLVQVTPTSSNQPPARDQWTTIAKEHIQDHRLNVVFKETAGTPGNALPNGVRPPQPGGAHEDTNLPQQQQQQQGAAAGGGGGEGTVSVQDLQSKYSELLQYNKAVEKEKAQLEKQVKALKEQQGAGRKGCPTYVVVLVIAVSLAIAKLVAWF
ncbi:unnamed protein product [Vitrella brassicaformis CCMP3155]|uniref:MSP domain-containing protein n=2 Tax=Vitrella brassicaformis TaxID=1169539 RepID=A0A0G4E966_VITBC|nr:unnamed protein product [Vitrella brassicaformis CCMP3155]|eukprot:CEL92105.1 unnamed protein product [Vitrella brassicaformis CCMP3155]